jgi:hypothetical protein
MLRISRNPLLATDEPAPTIRRQSMARATQHLLHVSNAARQIERLRFHRDWIQEVITAGDQEPARPRSQRPR